MNYSREPLNLQRSKNNRSPHGSHVQVFLLFLACYTDHSVNTRLACIQMHVDFNLLSLFYSRVFFRMLLYI